MKSRCFRRGFSAVRPRVAEAPLSSGCEIQCCASGALAINQTRIHNIFGDPQSWSHATASPRRASAGESSKLVSRNNLQAGESAGIATRET